MPAVGGMATASAPYWVPQVWASSSSAMLAGVRPSPKCMESRSQNRLASSGPKGCSGSAMNGRASSRG